MSNYICTLDQVFRLGRSSYMDRAMQKRVFWHMRKTKAQVSLRIRAVWSGPLLSANGIVRYYEMKREQRPFVRAQDDLNLCILRIFEGTFLLDTTNMVCHKADVKTCLFFLFVYALTIFFFINDLPLPCWIKRYNAHFLFSASQINRSR